MDIDNTYGECKRKTNDCAIVVSLVISIGHAVASSSIMVSIAGKFIICDRANNSCLFSGVNVSEVALHAAAF